MKMQRLIPMLPVNNISLSIEFYQKLGFTVEQRRDDWGWAMLRLDDCRIMLDQSINHHPGAGRHVLWHD
jgi:predicted lactoylglutathione lyase